MPVDTEVVLSRPVDVWRTLSTLRRGPHDPAFRRENSAVLWRTTREPSGPVTVRLEQLDSHRINVRAWGDGAVEHLERLPVLVGGLDDDADFSPRHPVVLDAHRRFPGLRIPATGRVMESLIPAVLEQRVQGVDAFAAWRRLLRAHGDPAPGPVGDTLRVAPTAETWAALPAWAWHEAGVDPQRYRTAQACARLGHQLDRLVTLGDRDRIYRGLLSIAGVGVWTAAEVGGRVLGDADAVPWGDYHLGSLVGTGLVGHRLTEQSDIAAALAPFAPHRLRTLRLLMLSPHVTVERRGPRSPRPDHRRR